MSIYEQPGTVILTNDGQQVTFFRVGREAVLQIVDVARHDCLEVSFTATSVSALGVQAHVAAAQVREAEATGVRG